MAALIDRANNFASYNVKKLTAAGLPGTLADGAGNPLAWSYFAADVTGS